MVASKNFTQFGEQFVLKFRTWVHGYLETRLTIVLLYQFSAESDNRPARSMCTWSNLEAGITRLPELVWRPLISGRRYTTMFITTLDQLF